ncbi:hypothetical protein [Nocardioides alcanivorans]|uniref:hypothetical protein n=1 Tax=Nocardioides alcanivorans TaxID=2897352 RepID=UPI001F457B61|nr:hypothetical protein [Nocardioides alcanivorans]
MPGSSRRRRGPVAAVLASALTLTSLGVLSVGVSPAQAAETPISSGSGLDWG